MRKGRDMYRVLVGKPEGKSPLGRTGCRWDDDIKMNHRDVGCGGGNNWVDLALDRDRWQALVDAVMNFRVP